MTPLVLVGSMLVAAYLIGAIPFGYLIARWRGVDIFQQGSGNIGATNVGRVLGRRFGIVVFVLDFAKGAVPVAAALALPCPLDLPPRALAVAVGLCAFLGHLFPIWLRFRGGKGVATGAGVVAVLLPGPTAVGLLLWGSVVAATRTVSAASIAAALGLCAGRLLLTSDPFNDENAILTVFCFVATALVITRHARNIGRLLRGTENRLPESPAMRNLSRTIHVLALGLWFGMVVFFVLVALSLFHTFESPAARPPEQRPEWVHLVTDYDRAKGTRLAGAAVGPIFQWYFLVQGLCGLLALLPALGWSRLPGRRVDRIRFLLLVLAFATVLIGYPLSNHVSSLRLERHSPDAAVAERATAAFATWHTVSLVLNFATLLLVTGAMATAANLPLTLPSPPADGGGGRVRGRNGDDTASAGSTSEPRRKEAPSETSS